MDATSLVSAWNALVVQLSFVFTEPTARVWRQIALGWVLHRGPATVTGIYQTLGDLADRHWTVYEKFFYRAAWSLNDLSLRLMMHVVYPLIVESGVIDEHSGKPVADVNVDDTTVGRCGQHVAHAGWFKDASASGASHRGTVIHWAHNWIVGAVTLRLPKWPGLRWVLPVLFALYRKRPDCNKAHAFRTRQVLAAAMVRDLAQACPQVQWRVTADGQYATREMIEGLPAGVTWSAAFAAMPRCTTCRRSGASPAGAGLRASVAGVCPRRGRWPGAADKDGRRSRFSIKAAR